MAALGTGIGRSAGARWRGRGSLAAIVAVLTASALAVNAPPARASQDPMFPSQWNLEQIHAPAAWPRSTGAGVRIGVVDSGVLAAQEDLAGKVDAATDCLDTGGDPAACNGSGLDDSGHGTHMAGIAAAAKDNGRGIAGVAPDAHLVVARVLTDDGGNITDVEAGIRWVVQHGARVVNLSVSDNPLAQSPLDLSFQSAVEEAWAAGAVPVVTAGNSTSLGPDRENFAPLDALVVGATDARGAVVSYSNGLSSAKWGVVAPGGSGKGDGGDVMSTWRNPALPLSVNLYASRGGTSVAAAHVSGVVALLLAQGLTPFEAVQQVLATAHPMACGPGCHGLVDAGAAVNATPLPQPVRGAVATTPGPVTPPSSTPPAPFASAPPPASVSSTAQAQPETAMAAPEPAAQHAQGGLMPGGGKVDRAVVALAVVALGLLLLSSARIATRSQRKRRGQAGGVL